MFNYTNSGITISSVLDNRRATNDNLYPIKIRVTFQRIRKYYATGKYLSINEWESLPDSKKKEMISIKVDIQNTFDTVKSVIKALLYEGGFSFEALNSRLNKSATDTLNNGFKLKIQALKDNDQVGTYLFYQNI